MSDGKTVAGLVRKALKKNFPGQKFQVRSSYGRVDIRWTDGPTQKAVNAVVGQYELGGFDGSIDLEFYSSIHILPDGTAVPGDSNGTEGSRGVYPAYSYPKPENTVQTLHGKVFIFTEREVNPDKLREIAEEYNREMCEDLQVDTKTLWGKTPSANYHFKRWSEEKGYL